MPQRIVHSYSMEERGTACVLKYTRLQDEFDPGGGGQFSKLKVEGEGRIVCLALVARISVVD